MNESDRTRFDEINGHLEQLTKSNGEIREKLFDGIAEQVQQIPKLAEAIAALSVEVGRLSGRLDGHMETGRPSTKTITFRRILEIAIGFGVVAVVSWIFLSIWLGKITPAEAAGLIDAARGGGSP